MKVTLRFCRDLSVIRCVCVCQLFEEVSRENSQLQAQLQDTQRVVSQTRVELEKATQVKTHFVRCGRRPSRGCLNGFLVQQRQERFSDCSALLELERKVTCWHGALNFSLGCSSVCSFVHLTTATPAVAHFPPLQPLEPPPHSFSLNCLCFFSSPPPTPKTSSSAVSRTGGCWSGAWQSWRRSWRWGGGVGGASDRCLWWALTLCMCVLE